MTARGYKKALDWVTVLVIGGSKMDYIQRSMGSLGSDAEAKESGVGEGHVSL